MRNPWVHLLGTVVRSGAIALVGAAALCGCRSTRERCTFNWPAPKAPLLDARGGVIPPPYSEPTQSGTAMTPCPPAAAAGSASFGVYQPDMEPVMPAPGELLVPVELEPVMVEPSVSTGVELPPVVATEALKHTVVKGENPWVVAQMYGVSHQELIAYNNIADPKRVSIGTVLRIPPGGKLIPPSERPRITRTGTGATGTAPLASDRKYTVQKGDSLWVIARRFGVTVADLKALNQLNSDLIHEGDTVTIPRGGDVVVTPTVARPVETLVIPREPLLPADPVFVDPAVAVDPDPLPVAPAGLPNLLDHTVLEKDTLQKIAEMYGTTVDEIKKVNPAIQSDADLKPNMKIVVPFE